ncbi:hypothetical protein BgiBS90_034819, partial [Biomphalaria glabrata]
IHKKIFSNKLAAANEVAKWTPVVSPFTSLFVRDFQNLEEPVNANRKRLAWPGRDAENEEEPLSL